MRTGRPATAALLLAALALGCAGGVRRPPADPSLPALPSAGFVAAAEGTAQPVEAGAWWRGLGGEPLDALVQEALRGSHDLRVVAARLDAAGAEARRVGASRKPSVAAALGAERRRQTFVGLPVPGGEDLLSSTSSSLGASLELSWEADLWGRLRAGRLAAREDLAGARDELAAAQESLAGRVARSWLALREAEAQWQLTRSTAESYRSSAGRLEERYRAGLVPALDLRLALSNAAGADALVAESRRQRDRRARQLELLLGRYPAGRVDGAGGLPVLPPPAPAGLPAELLGRRPDLRAQAARVRASGLRVVEANRARWPSLSLTARGGTVSDELSGLVDLDASVWSLAGNLLAPLFQGGRIRAGIDLSEAREDEAVAAFGGLILTALSEVESALASETALAERATAVGVELEQATAARRLAEEQYRRGVIDIVTLLEARRSALAAEGAALTVRRLRLEARVDLHLALGGGFEPAARPPSAPESSS